LDALSVLLERFPLRADVFYTGKLCGAYQFERTTKPAHVHCIKTGKVELTDGSAAPQTVSGPAILFMPQAGTHGLLAEPGTEVLCATVRFGAGGGNPMGSALPRVVVLSVDEASSLASLCELVFEEAGAGRPGRQVALNRLCELTVVSALRHCIDNGRLSGGILTGLADARLSRPLLAVHAQAGRDWSLDDLAALAGMSRARFALRFRSVTGTTPASFVTTCRVSWAQSLLLEGLELKQVAQRVGYGSPRALTRAFTRLVGLGPAHWLLSTRASRR
jgi:AraC-like DNA-binding protein